MKDCTGCVWAKWKRTAAGRLHPSGDGRCTKTIKAPDLPQAFYWLSGPPSPFGGHISRKATLKDDCTYYARGAQ